MTKEERRYDASDSDAFNICESESRQREYTGASVLAELKNRGDKQTEAILESLKRVDKWRREFC